MTTHDSRLGALLYNTESSFAEDSGTFGSRLLPLDSIDLSGLSQEMMPVNITRQYPDDGIQDVVGPMGGTFRTRLLLTGHGGTAAGALTPTDLATYMGHVIGALHSSNVGTTATGGTATIPTLAGGTIANGSLIRVGELGDGEGEGQWAAVSGLSGSNLTLLTALPGAPANGAVVYAAMHVYPEMTPTEWAAVQTLRFRALTPNQQVDMFGCWPMAFGIDGINAGETPTFWTDWGVAAHRSANTTFPSATSTDAKPGAPVANGSVFIQNVGTATRATFPIRGISAAFEQPCLVRRGPGGVHANQVVTMVRRGKPGSHSLQLTLTFDAEATGTQTWYDMFRTEAGSRSAKHLMIGFSVVDGRGFGLYAPNAKIMGGLPIQRDVDSLNSVSVTFGCMTGTQTTSDLSRSPWRIGLN